MLLKLIPNKLKVWLIKHLYADIADKGRMGDTRLAHINDYEAELLKSVGGSGTINPATGLVEYGGGKGGGGGGGAPAQQTTSYSSNLPEYAKPFYEELMKQSAKETYTTDASGNVTGVKTPDPYGDPRLAEFTSDQLSAQGEVRGMGPRGEFTEAIRDTDTLTGLSTDTAASGLASAGAYTPGTLASLGMETPAEFDAAAATKYMSPYQANVTELLKREARADAEMAKAKRGMGAIGRGTFGGGRQALVEGQANADTAALLNKIEAQGLQDAYKNAQEQFQRDRAAGMSAEEATLKANMDLRARGQQGEQFGAGLQKDLGLAGLQAGLVGAGQMGDLTTADQQANLARLQAQAASGGEQQQLEQERLNMAYQQFMEDQDAEKRALEFQSNILRGTAGALGSTQTQYAPAPSMASQIGGLGLAGLGLYNKLGG